MPTESELFGGRTWLDLTSVVASNVRGRDIVGTMAEDITADVIVDVMRTWTQSKQIGKNTNRNWKMAVQRALQRVPRYMEKHITWSQEAHMEHDVAELGWEHFEQSSQRPGRWSADEETPQEVPAPTDLLDPEHETVTREQYYKLTTGQRKGSGAA